MKPLTDAVQHVVHEVVAFTAQTRGARLRVLHTHVLTAKILAAPCQQIHARSHIIPHIFLPFSVFNERWDERVKIEGYVGIGLVVINTIVYTTTTVTQKWLSTGTSSPCIHASDAIKRVADFHLHQPQRRQ